MNIQVGWSRGRLNRLQGGMRKRDTPAGQHSPYFRDLTPRGVFFFFIEHHLLKGSYSRRGHTQEGSYSRGGRTQEGKLFKRGTYSGGEVFQEGDVLRRGSFSRGGRTQEGKLFEKGDVPQEGKLFKRGTYSGGEVIQEGGRTQEGKLFKKRELFFNVIISLLTKRISDQTLAKPSF